MRDLAALTCPTREMLREFTKNGSRSSTCPHESMGPTCPTRDPSTSLAPTQLTDELEMDADDLPLSVPDDGRELA